MRRSWLAGMWIVIAIAMTQSLPAAGKASTNHLFPARDTNGSYGFINEHGAWVFPPIFDLAGSFSEGFAPVWYQNRVGYIDTYGNLAIPYRFQYGRPFVEDRAEVELDGRWGFTRTDGSFAIEPRFDDVGSFHDGLASVREGSRWGFVNPEGELVITPRFRYARSFSGDIGFACNDQCGLIDRSGRWLLARCFSGLGEPADTLAAVLSGNRWGYLDIRTGEVVIGFRYERAYPFAEGLAAVRVDQKWGYIDRTGTFVIPPQFFQEPELHGEPMPPASTFVNGIAAVRFEGKWGYINRAGMFLIAPKFVGASNFRDGLASACTSDRCGYINFDGVFVWSRPR